ncbi:MAG: hypothetical protein RR190_01680, partial [Bacteroidales bacterium]
LYQRDSTYRITKNAALDTSVVLFYAKVAVCETFGDTLFVQIRGRDTTIVPLGKDIKDYVRDAFTPTGLIELLPCASQDTYAKYYLDKKLDPTLTSYQFRVGKTKLDLQNLDLSKMPSDSTINSTNWKFRDTSTLPDSLYVRIGTDSIYLQVVATNVCGASKLPPIFIRTIGTEPTKIAFVKIDSSLCFKELTSSFKLTENRDISSYIWHSPWEPSDYVGQKPLPGQLYVDTTHLFERSFKADSIKGQIYVQPRNGCVLKLTETEIAKLSSDTVDVNAVLYPPKRLRPANFASTYDTLLMFSAMDTLCLSHKLAAGHQYRVLPRAEDTLPLTYQWEIVKSTFTTLGGIPGDSLCILTKTEGADTTFLRVFAKVSVCETFGDTLQIELRTMDTVSMLTGDYIQDKQNGNVPIDLQPCGWSQVAYYINRDFHWSIDSTRFRWNGDTVIQNDSTLAQTDWKILNLQVLPDTLYAKVGNFDTLHLQAQVKNRCGWSQSKVFPIVPLSLIQLKPHIHIDSILCNNDTLSVSVDSVPFASQYVWHFPWKPQNYKGPDLPLGEYYTDTVSTYSRKFIGEYTKGLVWVTPINKCAQGDNSDTAEIKEIIHPPHGLKPRLDWISTDTLFDTICRYASPAYELKLLPNVADTQDSLVYHWSLLSGSLQIKPDDGTLVQVSNASQAPELNHIVAAVRWNKCKTYSDSLHIKLWVVDTVSMASLENIVLVDPALAFDKYVPCPGAEMQIGLSNPLVSPAYLWAFSHPSWHFKANTDSTSGVVTVIAGTGPATVSVRPITDASRSICPYVAKEPLVTILPITPVPALPTATWKEQPNPMPCVGDYQTYVLTPTENADAYRWEFPYGWKIEGTKDSILEAGVDTCRVLVGKGHGLISVYAIDTCDPLIPLVIQGIPITLQIAPIDSARVFLIGDRQPCLDSTSIYSIEMNASTADFDFEFIPEPANVDVTEVYQWNDSRTELTVHWNQITAATFVFKPILNSLGQACNYKIEDRIYIKADTVPSISGEITEGKPIICMNDIYEYRAHADMDTLGGPFTVGYTWKLPNNTWHFLSNPDSSWVRVVSGIYMDNTTDTIKCYPRAGCGTGQAFIFLVKLNKPDTLYNTIKVLNNDTNPCIGTTISLQLAHSDYSSDTISFHWFAPDSWKEIAPDSTRTFTNFKVGVESDSILVRGLRKGSCGLSVPLGIYIKTKDIPQAAQFSKPPYPCIGQENVGLSIAKDLTTDSLTWRFPDQIEYRLFANRIKYDSVLISAIGESPVSLHLEGFNKCGNKDTILEIRPVGQIQKFQNNIQIPPAVCANDTAYTDISIPLDHLEKGTEYHWFTPLDWTYLFDSIVVISKNPDTIFSRVWFKTNDKSGKISVYASNACGEIPEKEAKIDLYKIQVTATADPSTVSFLQSGVMLEIKDIVPPAINHYSYEWSPRNRVYKNEDELGNSEWWTGELIDSVEQFTVKATDQLTGFKCVGYDTVEIKVRGAFVVNFVTKPFVCRLDSIYLYANVRGGDVNRYSYQWSAKTEGSNAYVDLLGDAAFVPNPVIAQFADTIHFRLIARDT